jgi:hypothetical protein
MKDMGQQHLLPNRTHGAPDQTTDLPVLIDGVWQPQLPAAPGLQGPRGVTPGDRLRQAGLVGIAQARAALADATRRAEDARALDHGLGAGRAA